MTHGSSIVASKPARLRDLQVEQVLVIIFGGANPDARQDQGGDPPDRLPAGVLVGDTEAQAKYQECRCRQEALCGALRGVRSGNES
jgi:hypothetical protein